MSTDRLIFIEGPEVGLEVPLQEKVVIFGRSETADVTIDHIGVSRQHMQVSFYNGAYLVEDLGSRNGTFVNGARIEKAVSLDPGDEVQVGPGVRLRFEPAPPEASATVIDAPAAAAQMTPVTSPATGSKDAIPAAPAQTRQEAGENPGRLFIALPGREAEEHALTAGTIRLGRSNQNEIEVPVPTVSRLQFSLLREGDAYRLEVSSAASNPVYVNDAPVSGNQLLADQDEISIGPPQRSDSVRMRYSAPKSTAAETSEPEPAPRSGPVVQAEKDRTIIGDAAPAADVNATTVGGEKPASDTALKSGATVIGKVPAPAAAEPPQLVVNSPGIEPVIFTLTKKTTRIGRKAENDIVIENRFVSRFHAEIEKRQDGYYIIPSPSIGNPLLNDGVPVMEAMPLQHGAKLRIKGPQAGEMVTLVYLNPSEEAERARIKGIALAESKAMSIGRAPDNDMVLDSPLVSRIHAQVERVGQRYRIKDLNSSNGTFVNGERITGETWVKPGDMLLIGPFQIKVGESALSSAHQSESGMQIEAMGLNKWVRKDLNILQNISLAFQPREFIVVVGQSGGGKSTLVDAIAGYRPATHGRVMVNDTIDVYKNFDAIRTMIGYVPQKDIIHMELTVFQALDYAAQLRMPADTTEAERHQRIDEVMADLDLSHRRDTQISELSGGQQKRVSIGVELITKPGLFFLDEPTSGLDPGMETELMQLMRRLADQGRTIVMITHATKNVMLADKVVFLARGGYLTWFGPPEEALVYFDNFRSERQKRTKPMEFDDIYTLLDEDELGTGLDWATRFEKETAYRKYISDPLADKTPSGDQQPAVSKKAGRAKSQISALRQFFILSARNIKILTRDKFTLSLMLLSAPLMASLDFVLASGVGRGLFSFANGDFNDIVVTLIVLSNTAVMVGGLSTMRELVKERDIYKRERMVNLKLAPYIFSKLWFALLLAVYQAFFFVLIRHLAFDLPHEAIDVVYFSITVFLLVLAGLMMGLFTSAAAPNSNAAPLILVLFLLPQMVLSGALVPLPDIASAPASSRWAFQAVIGISGAGSDVAADSCWIDLTDDQRDDLTLDEKNSQCNCMGEDALRESSCNFPGLGEFYTSAIDDPEPQKPAEPGDQPEFPEMPEAPQPPQDMSDPLALQVFFTALDQYNEEVAGLQADFENDMNAYADEQEIFKDAIEVYQEDLAKFESEKAIAIGSAESTLKRFKDAYGWTFLNKDDPDAYVGTLVETWLAQSLIILVLFSGTILIQKSRDVT